MEQDTSVNCKVIDLVRKGFQDSRDILYVQRHQLHKDTLTAWIKQYIDKLNLPADHPKNPRVDDGYYTSQERTNAQNNRQQNTNTVNLVPLTKFHYIHGDESFKAASSEAGSKGRSSRSTGGRRSRGSNSIPTHVDLDVSSWADVVKKQVSKTSEKGGSVFGDNNSQHSQETDKSTIASIKSHREQELETMVEKLSIENVELKQAQQTTLQSQQQLMHANRELIEQVQMMKTQLATVKDDIRKEFDSKIDTIFELFRTQTDPQIPPPPSKVPRELEAGVATESLARKKQDNKSTPMYDRFLTMNENRQLLEQFHARNWLLHCFNSVAGPYQATGVPSYNYAIANDSMNLPQARADHRDNVG